MTIENKEKSNSWKLAVAVMFSLAAFLGFVDSAAALCWNPLQFFCIFQEQQVQLGAIQVVPDALPLSQISLSRSVVASPTVQFEVSRSGFEQYVGVSIEKINSTDYSFLLQVEPLLWSNISSCSAKPALDEINCLLALNKIVDKEGLKVYDFEPSKLAALVITGDLSNDYPVTNLTRGVKVSSASRGFSASGDASFHLSFPSGFRADERISVGVSTINVSTVNSSELVMSAAGATSAAFTPAVNRSSSILFVTSRQNESQAQRGEAECILGNVSQATASEVTCYLKTTPIRPWFIRWNVLEFNQGVSVQHGTVNLSGSASPFVNTVINEVNLSSSFILYGGSQSINVDWRSGPWKTFTFHNSTVFRTSFAIVAGADSNVSYQVVSMDGARVFTDNKTIAATDRTDFFNLTSPIVVNRSFILASTTHTGGTAAQVGARSVTGSIMNATQVKIERGTSGGAGVNTMNMTWQLVELPDGNTVQNFSLSFPEGQTIINQTVSSVNLNQSVAFASGMSAQGATGGITHHLLGDFPGLAFATATLTNSTNLQVNRTLATVNTNESNITFYVIQFAQSSTAAGGDTTPPTNLSLFSNVTGFLILMDTLMSSQWKDSGTNATLSSFIFSWNATGLGCDTWANDSVTPFGADGWANVTKTVPATCTGKVGNIAFQFFANDTSGNNATTPRKRLNEDVAASADNNATLNITLNNAANFNITQNRTFSVNATVTAVNGSGHQVNGTVYFGIGAVNNRLNDSASALPLFNVSGFQNVTCSSFLANNSGCSLNWTVNATGVGYYNLTINFTSNNSFVKQNGTPLFFLNISQPVAVETVAPLFFNNNTNSTNFTRYEVLGLSVNISDEIALANVTLGTNNSDNIFSNMTLQISGLNFNVTFNYSVVMNRSRNFAFEFFVCDTANNCNSTARRILTVNNSQPVQESEPVFVDYVTNSFNFSYAVRDNDDANDIRFRNLSFAGSGECSYLSNTTIGDVFTLTGNCTGTPLSTMTVSLNVSDGQLGFTKSFTRQLPELPSRDWELGVAIFMMAAVFAILKTGFEVGSRQDAEVQSEPRLIEARRKDGDNNAAGSSSSYSFNKHPVLKFGAFLTSWWALVLAVGFLMNAAQSRSASAAVTDLIVISFQVVMFTAILLTAYCLVYLVWKNFRVLIEVARKLGVVKRK